MLKKIALLTIGLTVGLSSQVFASTVTHLGPYQTKILHKEVKDSEGNKHFNAGYRFFYDVSYQEDVSTGIPYAAYIGTQNKVSVKAFKDFTIAQVDAHIAVNEAHPTLLGEFKRNTVFFDKTYWPNGAHKQFIKGAVANLWTTKDSADKEKYMVYKTDTSTYAFPIGPIPFKVTAGIKGSAGIVGSLDLRSPSNANIDFRFGPEAKITAITEAGVDVGIAKGMAETDLDLINVGQYVHSNIELSLLRRSATLKFNLPGKIQSLSGQVRLNGSIRKIEMCTKRVWRIKVKYPCGFGWKEVVNKTIANWKGFVKNWNLYSYSRVFS